jgi:hypothetical protein
VCTARLPGVSMPPMPVLTPAQMETFEKDGAILVDTPFTSAQMDSIEAAWDRITTKETNTWTDHDYLDMLADPFFEAVACQVLRADAVQVLETYPHNRPPSGDLDDSEPREQRDYRTWGGGHLDVQITRSDWEATPRREMLAIWLWCNDVPLERGPMRVLKGSHLPIADHWEQVLHDPAKLAQLPRVHGLGPVTRRGEHEPGSGGTYSGIPELMDVPWAEQKPEKVVAKRGQALVFSQALLHEATANEDSVSRKAHIMSWTAASVPGFLATGRIEGMRDYHEKLRAKLLEYKPDRAHLVPESFMHDISEYGNAPTGEYWDEMFLPVEPQAAKL